MSISRRDLLDAGYSSDEVDMMLPPASVPAPQDASGYCTCNAVTRGICPIHGSSGGNTTGGTRDTVWPLPERPEGERDTSHDLHRIPEPEGGWGTESAPQDASEPSADTCGRQSDSAGYAPCTRVKGHKPPCAHPFSESRMDECYKHFGEFYGLPAAVPQVETAADFDIGAFRASIEDALKMSWGPYNVYPYFEGALKLCDYASSRIRQL